MSQRELSKEDLRCIYGLRRACAAALSEGHEKAFVGLSKILVNAVGGCGELESMRALVGPMLADENTGLNCPDCGTKQRKIDVVNMPDGGLFVRLSGIVVASERNKEIDGICGMLNMFKVDS